MKKEFLLATAALMITGVSMADTVIGSFDRVATVIGNKF